jgi:hypothetical protein
MILLMASDVIVPALQRRHSPGVLLVGDIRRALLGSAAAVGSHAAARYRDPPKEPHIREVDIPLQSQSEDKFQSIVQDKF